MSSDSLPALAAELDPQRLPAHVAVIMDGNGRWATRRLMNRIKGHEQGAEVVSRLVRTCSDLGIDILTLYAFSTENWRRSRAEVSALMHILQRFLKKELPEMTANNICFHIIGQPHRLPEYVREEIARACEATRENTGTMLQLALSYGGRAELTETVRILSRKAAAGELNPDDITEEMVSASLFTAGQPDPDLMIRTSGEQRISNFLPWQLAYAEFHFTPTLWPDFTPEEFIRILREYQGRDRRFGNVSV